MFNIFKALTLLIGLFVMGCAQSEKPQSGASQAAVKASTSTFTLPSSASHLVVLDPVSVNHVELKFLMDTGATRSAIFEGSLEKLNLLNNGKRRRLVHGMSKSQDQALVNIDTLKIGALTYNNMDFIVLPLRSEREPGEEPFDGLIGMDILEDLQITVRPDVSQVSLTPVEVPIEVPPSWDKISFKEATVDNDNRNLSFFKMRMAGKLAPALLDTGSQISVMNWKAASFPQVKARRKSLRQKWIVEGANGEFSPTAKVSIERIRAGQKFWDTQEFLVSDLKSLDVLGAGDGPFIIAGMNLLADEAFFIDFRRKFLAIEPRSAKRKEAPKPHN